MELRVFLLELVVGISDNAGDAKCDKALVEHL